MIIEEQNENIQNIDYDTIVLAGGSTNGIVILGGLQYAYDNFLLKNIKTYIGTSSGAIISFLLTIGYTPIEIIVYICKNQLLEKMQHFNIVAMIQGRGASSFNNIHEQLEKMTITKIGYLPTLGDIKKNFNISLIFVTYNITEDRVEYLKSDTHPTLPCLTAIRMSSNLPLIFENYKYGNSFYIDGGISDNFAIDIAEEVGSKIMGISLESTRENFNSDPDTNILEYIYKLMFIPIRQQEKYKISKVSKKTKIINLSYLNVKFFDFTITSKTKLEMFSAGYQQMKDQIEA